MKIIFVILPIAVFNLYQMKFDVEEYSGLVYFLKPNKTEYIIIYSAKTLFAQGSYLMRIDAKTDKMIAHVKLFDTSFKSFINLRNNLNIYFFSNYLVIEKNGKKDILRFASFLGHTFSDQAYSSNSIIFGTDLPTADENFNYGYRIQLVLVKEPYIEFYGAIIIEKLARTDSFKLIGLKDYFIFVKIDKVNYYPMETNYTYRILDLNLNLLNSVSVKYTNYTEIIFSDLSENNDVNEYFICIKYQNISTECQIIKCENSDLLFLEKYEIFSQHEIFDRFHHYHLTINPFDKNKIGCYLASSHLRSVYDFVTILQYKSKELSYYKDIKDIATPSINEVTIQGQKMVMTEKGIAVLSQSGDIYLSYLTSVCRSINITLYPNSLSDFPINEFIFPGIDQFQFSFVEIYKYLTIYKNSTEIKIGEIFHDLNNFTYFLKTETYFEDFFLIKVKNHGIYDICSIYINVNIPTNISTYKESHKCLKNDNYDKINNIIHSNLFDYFNADGKDVIQFEFIMENEPKGNELIINFEDRTLECIHNHTKIICKGQLFFFPRLKRIHLYSYLSCYNLIDLGWFEINDKKIFNIYNLINYDFEQISEIYDPSQKITEYNPAMINYYYWFSCFSYCDDKKIEKKDCCSNILDRWEIVFHKEYNYAKKLLDFFVDIVFEIVQKTKSQGDLYDVRGDIPSEEYIDDLYEQYYKNKENIISRLKKGKEYLSSTFISPYLEQLMNAIYQYNFVILKNDEYKKIVVAFPGLTFYFQILDELIHEGMVDLLDIPTKVKKKYFSVLEMYYKIFIKLKDDLFDNLEAISGINGTDYQVVFTGHSIGGAIATISSFYYIKKYNFMAENILITFGQPKVGNEIFAKELTKNLKQIYRVARPNDIATLFPSMKADYLFKFLKIAKLALNMFLFLKDIVTGNLLGLASTAINLIVNRNIIASKYAFIIHDAYIIEDYTYTHIGGLYMIDDDTNTVYHCDDFYNEKRDHFICKNHNKNFFSPFIINDFFHYRNYLSINQEMISSCQKKKFQYFILRPGNAYNYLLRRLEMNNNINNNYELNYKTNKIRKLDNIEDIQETLTVYKETEFKLNKYEFCFKYKSQEKLQKDNLILIIKPKNNNFFGEICFFQNITWLINNEYDFLTCYFINNKKPFSLRISLKKQIINEKELFIYIKGKFSGTLELYDLSQNKTLNKSSSYYIPYINNFPLEQSLNLILPKLEENLYMNVIINDYGFIDNKTISSIFEIYESQKKINYDKKALILEKDKEYYFKYYPNKNEILINFIPINFNKFLEKQFYIVNEQNIFINYNIELINNNQSFGLFFEFNGIINNIKGYFSNTTKHQDNINDYILNNNNNKYFILTKNSQFNFLNLDINVESEFLSELIIYDISETIIINKINSLYEIKKDKHYLFFLDENLQKNYSKFESFTLISIKNSNNFIKLLLLDGDIILSKNYLLNQLYNIKSIFIKVIEDDIFEIKLISEEMSKYIFEESGTYFGNTFMDDSKYSIDFIHNNEDIYIFSTIQYQLI